MIKVRKFLNLYHILSRIAISALVPFWICARPVRYCSTTEILVILAYRLLPKEPGVNGEKEDA